MARKVSSMFAEANALDSMAPDTSPVRRAFAAGQADVLAEWSRQIADHRIMVAELRRQAIEDQRSIRRNRNRALTLLGALLIGLVIVFASTHALIPPALAPYAFVITVALDSVFVFYSLVRRY